MSNVNEIINYYRMHDGDPLKSVSVEHAGFGKEHPVMLQTLK